MREARQCRTSIRTSPCWPCGSWAPSPARWFRLAYMMPKSAREAGGAGDCLACLSGLVFRWPGWRGAGAMDGGVSELLSPSEILLTGSGGGQHDGLVGARGAGADCRADGAGTRQGIGPPADCDQHQNQITKGQPMAAKALPGWLAQACRSGSGRCERRRQVFFWLMPACFGAVDLGRDVIEPGGPFAASLKRRGAGDVRMLYQHDPDQPIGRWLSIRRGRARTACRGQAVARRGPRPGSARIDEIRRALTGCRSASRQFAPAPRPRAECAGS